MFDMVLTTLLHIIFRVVSGKYKEIKHSVKSTIANNKRHFLAFQYNALTGEFKVFVDLKVS